VTPQLQDRQFVTALARGLEILRCFGSGEERLSNQELSDRCSLPKSTVTRLTHTLTSLGYLHHIAETGRYRLGMTTLALSGSTLSRLDVKELSRPLMQQLAEQTGTLVSLGIFDDMSMVYIENCRGLSLVTLRLDIGSRIPVAVTAMGRAYLAGLSAQAREPVESRLQALTKERWPDIHRAIERACAEYELTGCCASFGEWHADVNGIAVPVHAGIELPLLALNAAGPARMLPQAYLLNDVRPQLIAVGKQIESRLRMRH
jgi:DNA-binding IclR family transcriptional regulator